MPHLSHSETLDAVVQQTLLQVARQVLETAANGIPYQLTDTDKVVLQMPAASFVTLKKNGQLRGCIGSLEAFQPLIKDVIKNTRAAALEDPRFTPVRPQELEDIHIEISVLTTPQPMRFDNKEDLLAQIQPFTDGLVLQEGARRATFLPSVWQQLPDKADFLQQLKIKAGLPADGWSDNIQVSRYHTQIFGE